MPIISRAELDDGANGSFSHFFYSAFKIIPVKAYFSL